MARAAAAVRETAEAEKLPKPLLLGVTVLTSLKSAELDEVGMHADVASQVLRLAGLAKASGMDGVVCSPQEIAIVRKEFGRELLVVTPGIRPAWADAQDQKRIMTPAEAVALGGGLPRDRPAHHRSPITGGRVPKDRRRDRRSHEVTGIGT